jgi:diacylglycerol kinase (ATP)
MVGITDVRLTKRPGDERDLAARAASEGIDTIVALGGDGTWGNVSRGILEAGRDTRLVPIAAGTGNDFPHALGLPAHDAVAMAGIAAGSSHVRVDVGWANDVAFLNVAGVGVDTAVLQTISRIRRLSGPLLYIAAALPVLRTYPGFRASLQFGDKPVGPMQDWCVILASNGPLFGGGFKVAPNASVTDGLLDLVSVRDARPLRRLQLFLRARFGAHLGQSETALESTAAVTIRLEKRLLLDADGELHALESNEVNIRVQPQALSVGTSSGTIQQHLVADHAKTSG